MTQTNNESLGREERTEALAGEEGGGGGETTGFIGFFARCLKSYSPLGDVTASMTYLLPHESIG